MNMSSEEEEEENYSNRISEEALQVYDRMFNNKEWPGYRRQTCETPMPLLIMEILRLVPYVDRSKINFHPLNMPNTRIKQIRIVGRITFVNVKNRVIELNVEDGTGTFSVVYKSSLYEDVKAQRKKISQKHRTIAEDAVNSKPWPDTDPGTWKMHKLAFHNIRPPVDYNPSIPIPYRVKLEHDWWMETKCGLLGKDFQINDRVSVRGFIGMDFEQGTFPLNEVTVTDLRMGKLYCFAMEVRCVTEHEYNKVMRTVICKKIYERYSSS